MVKMLGILWYLFWLMVLGPARAEAQPQVSAASYLLMESQTGQVLLAHRGEEKRPPASTTKILTCITAMDLADPDELVSVSANADRVGDATIYLSTGEIFDLRSLLQGALIKSGNDAAVAIAEQVAGDEHLFMDLANRKARILGAVNTEFYNPHGLPHPKHVTTAYDLALITRYAMGNEDFAAMVGTKETVIMSLDGRRKVYLVNTNKLLWNNPEVTGVKTGTTNKAGMCLVSAAAKDGRELIAVVLKSRDRYADAERLLNWGFEEFALQSLNEVLGILVLDVAGGAPACVTARPSYDAAWSVPKHQRLEIQVELTGPLQAPIRRGETVGTVTVSLAGKELETVPLVAGEDVLSHRPKRFWLFKN
ncbi:MAG TPA: D-alanyl-D-alanine carboxypeptidase [Clostridia bacterium]|nr:D-alanyl-D-alanine carboxypeptidase [Clostridia bacterium]